MELSKTFVDSCEGINEDQCMEGIVLASQKIAETEKERDEFEQLTQAKELVKTLGSGFSTAIKLEKKKINFLLGKLKEIQDGTVNPDSGNKR